MSTLTVSRDAAVTGDEYSPGIDKAANRAFYNVGSPLRFAKPKLLFVVCILWFAVWFSSRIGRLMGWNHHQPSSVYSPSRGGYTVLINTWKRNSLLKRAVAHYASCRGTETIHVAWSETDPPSDRLKADLKKIVRNKSNANLRFELNGQKTSNNRFKPIKGLRTDAIFSVDDDVIVLCDTLAFAFTVWQTAPMTMVGFEPRMHLQDKQINGVTSYKYGGWWSVWWTGTYSMVLSKAAFFHRKYMDLYTNKMSSSIHDYVTKERNCEDIAMSFLVANTTDAPPIWVQGISSLKRHNYRSSKCLNDLLSLYGTMPLVSTNVRAVDATHEWLW